MGREENIQSLENTLATYEKMRDSYITEMNSIKLSLECMPCGIKKENLLYAYDNQAEGLRGIISYINALKEKLEAIKNDPNYDDECKYSL